MNIISILSKNVNGEPVTEAGLCNAMNFNNLENAVGRLNDNLQLFSMTIRDYRTVSVI